MKPESLQDWVERWRRVGPRLAQIHEEELLHEDLARTIELLEDAFLAALQSHPPEPTSGLVEQQKYFMRLKV